MGFTSGRYQRTAAAIAVGMLISSVAIAQSSEGSIYGRGKPGDRVTITSVETGTSRTITVDPNGTFNAPKLQPGAYRVEGGGVARDVNVSIGSGTAVTLAADTVADPASGNVARVVVSGTRTVIDTSSVESNTVFSAEQMAALPVARDPNAFALLAPGVVRGDADLGDGGLPSFGGASVAENSYYINGFDVTNIRNFLSYANLPLDAVAAQQVKTGGYGAEFGRSLGGVISLVTKRGTNTWKGGASVYFEPDSLRSRGKDIPDLNDPEDNNYIAFRQARKQRDLSFNAYAGGPLIKDKLFVFGLIEGRHDRTDTFAESSSTRNTSTKPNGMVKVDFTPTDAHRIELTAISNEDENEVLDFNRDISVYPDRKNLTYHMGEPGISKITSGGEILIGKYTGYLTDNLTVSALVGSVNEKLARTVGARQTGLDCPVILEIDQAEIGCWAKPFPGPRVRSPNAKPADEDKRRAFRFDVDYTIGSHTLRAGVDRQTFTSYAGAEAVYSGGYYYRYYVSDTGTVNGVPNAVAPGGQYVRRRETTNTGGSFEVENNAYYVEDSWKVTNNVLLYAGLRSESFDNKNGDGISFVKADNLLAPRLGFSWDVKGDASLKVYGNAGRYFIPVASNTNIRATQGELFEQRFYTFTGRDPRTQAPLGLSANDIGLAQITGDGTLPHPATIADTELNPMSQDEFILGFQKALAKGWTMGLKATYRKINDGMDDYCSHLGFDRWAADNGYNNFDSSTMATCFLLNPGNDVTLQMDLNNDGNLKETVIPASYLGLGKYTRTYRAVELTAERPFNGTWGLSASYTWAKLKGTAEGYVNSVINQEDAGVSQDFDFGSLDDGADGYLSNDRRHVFKVYGNYAINDTLRLGFNGTVASGRPYSCIGFVPESAYDYADARAYTTASSYYCLREGGTSSLVQRGSVGRTPWTGTLDLQLAYMPRLAVGKVSFQLDVFNVFNSQKAVEFDERRDYSADTLSEGKLNLNYRQPSGFQSPRSVRLSARYEF